MAHRSHGLDIKRVLVALLVLLVPCFLVTSANAASLTFDQTGVMQAGGFLYYVGGNNPLVGSQIQFHEILSNGTPLNDGANLLCDTCFLNFETGNFVSRTGDLYTFGGGGEITMDGTIDFPGPDFTGLILEGEFSNTPMPLLTRRTGGTLTGFGSDRKARELNSFFGINETWAFTNTTIVYNRLRQCDEDEEVGDVNNNGVQCFNFNEEFSLSQLEGDGRYAGGDDVTLTIGTGGFVLAVDTADFQNRPAPAPGTAALLMLGVSALVASRRRKS